MRALEAPPERHRRPAWRRGEDEEPRPGDPGDALGASADALVAGLLALLGWVDGAPRAELQPGAPADLVNVSLDGVTLTGTPPEHAVEGSQELAVEYMTGMSDLIAENTVEERILKLQEQKRELARAAMDEEALARSLTREELLSLFE